MQQLIEASTRVKYPRTPHLPFSPGATSDDKVLRSIEHFVGREVVVTVKMDGENTTLYRDGFHARSLDSRHHPSRDWVKAFHASFAWKIPRGWRICGENLYAVHSIHYTDLPSYFLAFSVWDEHNVCLDWDTTLLFLEDLGVEPVPQLYRGPFEADAIQDVVRRLDTSRDEGIVVRLADSFHYDDFGLSVAKWVRPGHVQSDQHWMHGPIRVNGLQRSELTDEEKSERNSHV